MNPDTLIYWMYERQSIYEKKEAGLPWPWTDDKILQTYRFCNVFREQDKVTKYIRSWCYDTKEVSQIIAMAIARFFNLPETIACIDPSSTDFKSLLKVLTEREKEGYKIFSPAYIISPCGSTKPKIQRVIEDYITPLAVDVYSGAFELDETSLQNSWKKLCEYQGFGPFMSYEVITDLRHTPWLKNAKDIYSWANAGPGAIRGLNRLSERHLKCRLKPVVYNQEMCELLNTCKVRLESYGSVWKNLEMRDIEHSLCETDKYLRVLNGEGTPKEKYRK